MKVRLARQLAAASSHRRCTKCLGVQSLANRNGSIKDVCNRSVCAIQSKVWMDDFDLAQLCRRCEWGLVSLKRLGGLGRTRCGGVMALK
jgi:hypothetical protein